MKVCHTLICCFFLSLQDGNPVLVNAQLFVYSGTEGGNITVQCRFGSSGQRKFFCKGECKAENVLIATTDVRAQRGRYSIRHEAGLITGVNLYVTITQLTKSDSGLYNCGLGTTQFSYRELEIIVVDTQLDGSSDPSEEKTLYTRTGGTVTVECSFTSFGTWRHLCKDRCRTRNEILVETDGDTGQRDRYSIRYLTGSRGGFLFVTITQLNTSDSGRYRCGQDRLAASRSHRNFQIIVEDAPVPSTTTPTTTTTTPTVTSPLLYACLTPVVVVILLSLTLVIICVKMKTKLCGLVTGGNSDSMNMEITQYENCPPVSTGEDSTYQSLSSATRDRDQTYTSLTHIQHK
ncbi:polymeric immunoglobulin receptor-like isoform X2 [Trachinotus anak]|uniref:polymeric immunoglobulin receptor-like isoform X2 n=1 Tax=Trachinotus anak TaxID=443729 RepID=UPI0039F1EF3B